MVNSQFDGSSPVGYDALVARFNLQVIPNWHHSRTSKSNIHQTHTDASQVVEIYPRFLTPQETRGGQLEFALKYDGTKIDYDSVVDTILNNLRGRRRRGKRGEDEPAANLCLIKRRHVLPYS